MSCGAFARSSEPPISGAVLAGLPVPGWMMPGAEPVAQAISAAARVLPVLCCSGDAARGAGAAQPGADACQEGLGLLARHALELEDLVHQVLDVLGHVAQGRGRVAGGHHGQAADEGAEQVLHRALQAADQGFELAGVEQAGEVVDEAVAEGEGAARGGDAEVVQRRDRPGRQGRVACRQAAAQRLSEAVEAGRFQVVVGERRQGILEQVGQCTPEAPDRNSPDINKDSRQRLTHKHLLMHAPDAARQHVGRRAEQRGQQDRRPHVGKRQRRDEVDDQTARPYQSEHPARLQGAQAESR